MSETNKTSVERMKELFDGAAGVRSIIYIFLFMASGFSLYHAMKGSIDMALAQSNTNSIYVERHAEALNGLDDRLDRLEFKTEQAAKTDEEQTRAIQNQAQAIQHQTILIERIATKLNVDTDR